MNIEQLITRTRLISDNSDGAITDDEIIYYLNNGLERIQGLVMQNHPENDDFAMEAYIQLNASQDTYPLDALVDENGVALKERFFNRNAISIVEISNAANVFMPIPKISSKERISGFGYFIRGKFLTLTSIPSSSTLKARLTGAKKFFRLDKRRGQITGKTEIAGNTQLALASIPADTLFTGIQKASVVDEDGNVNANFAFIESFSSPNLLLRGVDFASVNIGDFVCYGEYSSTHTDTDDIFDKYLVEYAAMRIFMRDSSKDLGPQVEFVNSIEKEIIETIATMGADASLVPILNSDNLIW